MMEKISIKTKSIKLDQFLKWSGLAYTGGEAKMMIQEGIIMVNGEIERRRGRSLVPGDEIEIADQGRYQITRE